MNAPENKKTEKLDPKRRGLGRGLSALFEDDEEDNISSFSEDSAELSRGTSQRRTIGIDQLEPGPFQPRQMMKPEALRDLAASITTHGVLQPILVREKQGFPDTYEIIAGERRWRASQKAQLHEVPVIVKSLSDQQASEIALIENLQREDLNAMEEAQTYRRLIDRFEYTQEKLAAGIGKSRPHIANMMRLLTLPEAVQDMVMAEKLSAGHARPLIGLDSAKELAQKIAAQGLSVREAEQLAAQTKGKPTRAQKRKATKDTDTLALENDISNALGMKVTIDAKGKSGAVKIKFKDLDQLDEILRRLSHRS